MTAHSFDPFVQPERTKPASRYYAGRLIFDHLPKTAGQAVSAWLRAALGEGCVTDNLIGQHRELIGSYGGTFSVISGHIHFAPGEGLDPRYQYATALRDPVDRVVSWLFFVLKNHEEEQLPELYGQCARFIETDGEVLGKELKGAISNLYMHHFSRIIGSGEEDDTTCLANAMAALECYDVVGIYENLPDFINNLGALIGILAPNRLEQINVTLARPSVAQISAKLRDRIVELNEMDLQLYAAVRDMSKEIPPKHAPTESVWIPLPSRQPRVHTTDDFIVHNVEMLTSSPVRAGGVLSFALEIELLSHISSLEAGIHIFDDQRRWAFGVNSTMLKQNHANMKPGRYRLIHHIVARLPTGRFTAGFAFAETTAEPARELFWHDALCAFSVIGEGTDPGVGYAICPARLTLSRNIDRQQLATCEAIITPGAGS